MQEAGEKRHSLRTEYIPQWERREELEVEQMSGEICSVSGGKGFKSFQKACNTGNSGGKHTSVKNTLTMSFTSEIRLRALVCASIRMVLNSISGTDMNFPWCMASDSPCRYPGAGQNIRNTCHLSHTRVFCNTWKLHLLVSVKMVKNHQSDFEG